MSDVLVTVPKSFGLDRWIAEGDAAGEPWSGTEWYFYLGGHPPYIRAGERVYVAYNGIIRGYAPLVRIAFFQNQYALVRRGDAVAVTVPGLVIPGFRGFRYRRWEREQEVPFPDWRRPNLQYLGADRALTLQL